MWPRPLFSVVAIICQWRILSPGSVEAFSLLSGGPSLLRNSQVTDLYSSTSRFRMQSYTASASRLLMSAGDLHTAYEWLAKERDSPVSSIKWIDILNASADRGNDSADVDSAHGIEPMRLPLYPLGSCYVPSEHIQTLNNVEPRNIKMAQDLNDGQWDGRFCVALRAADTGRLASTGTLMRMLEIDEQRSCDGTVLRTRVKCVAQGLVEIESIENPDCWSRESKLLRSDEYLVANVRPRGDKEVAATNVDEDIFHRIATDYSLVRSMYVNKRGVAARELPPFAIDAVQNIPELSEDNFRGDNSFWNAAGVWQILCNTVREARRCDLQSEVNELTISAAMEKGGPLTLPVHRSDLPVEVQYQLNRMEENAAKDFLALGMDPCLDFQGLISCKDSYVRLRHLANMISREKKRLETKECLKELFDATHDNADLHDKTSFQ